VDAGDRGLGAHGMAEAPVRVLAALGVVAPLVLGTGCGETCNSTCFRAYDERECDVDTPGVPADLRINECISDCRAALRQVGPMGSYSPLASGSVEQAALMNERQAAAWMDCIAESTCEQLQGGRCNPL